MSNTMKVILGSLAAVIGAAATGGATAASQYIAANGATQDWKPVAGAAAAGALVGVFGLFAKSPLQK